MFFGPIGKLRCLPRLLIGWDIFDFSETAELNSTKLVKKQDIKVLYQVCVFRADWKKQDGHPSLWLAETFSTSPLKPLNEIQWKLTGSKISTSSTKFVFFFGGGGGGGSGGGDGRPACDWLRHLQILLNGIQRNCTGSKISMSSTKFVFFLLIGKTRWPPRPLIGWTFSTSPLKLLNGIQRNLTGSKISTSSAKFEFFGPIGKNKMTALASDWLRHFLAGLQSNSGLWIDDVRLSVRPSVRQHLVNLG